MSNFEPNFLEIAFAEIVEDIRKEFDYIDQISLSKHNRTPALRTSYFPLGSVQSVHLEYIFKKYPFLYPHVLVFKLPPGGRIPIHQDGIHTEKIRFVSLNIPIENCTSSCVTEFFDIDDKWMGISPEGRAMTIKPDAIQNGLVIVKEDEYSLQDNPILVNTQKPHRITNHGSTSRVSVSWTTTFKTLQEAKEYFKDRLINP